MTPHLGDWRNEIEAIDAELMRLVNRRAQLAIEILRTLRTEISLGELARDADRLMLLTWPKGTPGDSLLDEKTMHRFFLIISKECRRIAEEEISLLEHNPEVDLSISEVSKRGSVLQR